MVLHAFLGKLACILQQFKIKVVNVGFELGCIQFAFDSGFTGAQQQKRIRSGVFRKLLEDVTGLYLVCEILLDLPSSTS